MKKICMTELLGGRMLGQLEPVRAEEVRRLVEVIHGKVGREVCSHIYRILFYLKCLLQIWSLITY